MMKTPTKRVRGLGAAKEGVDHFWHQRLTAVALIPLVVWFLASLVAHAGASYEEMRGYLAQPLTAVLMILLLLAGFYHMKLGVQVVIEDYIRKDSTKVALLILNNFAAIAIGLACVYSVIRVSVSA